MLLNLRYEINPQTDYIDSGGYGKVYKAYDTQAGETVALKQFIANNMPERYSLQHEIQRASSLQHPNIVRYLQYFETTSTDSMGVTQNEQWAVMEYMPSGNLNDVLQNPQHPARQHINSIWQQILEGLKYLHTSRYDNTRNEWVTIIHRDLKPANILLQATNSGTYIAKIADFGISKEVLGNTKGETTSTISPSTIEYAAPEYFNPALLQGNALSQQTDYWALGVLLYRYYTGTMPFGSRTDGNSQEQIMRNILSHQPNYNQIPAPWQSLCQQCLQKKPSDRVLASQTIAPTTNNEQKATPVSKVENINTKQKWKNRYLVPIFLMGLILFGAFYFYLHKKQFDTTPYSNEIIDLEIKEGSNGKWGFINKNNETVIPFVYDFAYYFNEGLANVQKDGKFGFINKNNETVIPFVYDFAGDFNEGLAGVIKEAKWGFINKNNETVIPIVYDLIHVFKEDLASVKKDGKWGFINKKNETVIPFVYDDAGFFNEGLTEVKKDGEWFYINKKGECVKDCPPTLKKIKDIAPDVKDQKSAPDAKQEIKKHTNIKSHVNERTKLIKEVEEADANEVFTFVEQQAEFTGGSGEYVKYFQSNLKYPDLARESGIEGKVFVEFVINADGSIQDAKIRKGIGGGCDEEALRVIKLMPNWKPAKQNGKIVRSKFTAIVTFKLE